MTGQVRSVLLLGATGTIGRATAQVLTEAGWRVTAPVRSAAQARDLPGTRPGPVTADSLQAMIMGGGYDAVISCLASRTGLPEEAWAVDYGLNSAALSAAVEAGVPKFVYLSAICVQKPRLAFQFAKLAFEAELRQAPLTWSIVRPTAYFKSLSGQIDRLRAGKPFLLFGDGALTACKPISDADLARYMLRCMSERALQNRINPIGGPGDPITPRQQGELLFKALNLPPRYRHVPIGAFSAIGSGLRLVGAVSSRARTKGELARIGMYYATESMLLWDEKAQRYDGEATPAFGTKTLAEHYTHLAHSGASSDLGPAALF